jgi:protein-disulfide isomerase
MAQILEERPELIVEALKRHPGTLSALRAEVAPTPEQLRSLFENSPDVFLQALQKNRDQLAKLLPPPEPKAEAESCSTPAAPEIDPKRAMLGPAAAPVTIVAYTDFQYPPCARAAKTLREVLARYAGKVRLLLKHNPQEAHPGAMPASEYFEALAIQSPLLAYRFHDQILFHQSELDDEGAFAGRMARKLAVDRKQLEADRRSGAVRTRVLRDQEEAEKLGLHRSPSFVINGEKVEGAAPLSTFVQVIERKLSEKKG